MWKIFLQFCILTRDACDIWSSEDCRIVFFFVQRSQSFFYSLCICVCWLQKRVYPCMGFTRFKKVSQKLSLLLPAYLLRSSIVRTMIISITFHRSCSYPINYCVQQCCYVYYLVSQKFLVFTSYRVIPWCFFVLWCSSMAPSTSFDVKDLIGGDKRIIYPMQSYTVVKQYYDVIVIASDI